MLWDSQIRLEKKPWESTRVMGICVEQRNHHKDYHVSSSSYLFTMGRFTLSTRNSSHGVVRALFGCWTRPGITSVSTKETMAEWSWRSRSQKYIFWGLINTLTWSNRFCGDKLRQERWCGKKRQGPMVHKCSYNTLLVNFFGGFYT